MQTFRWFVVVGLVVAAGCSGSDGAEPPVTAPVPTAPPTDVPVDPTTSTLESTPSTDDPIEATSTTAAESPTSTEPEESTTTAANPDGFLPADLGTPVDSAPGVNSPGEVVELMEMVWLYVPTEADPDDANVVVPLAEDAPIIEAYGRAMAALYGQVTQNPIPVEPSGEMAMTFVDGGAKYSENVFAVRNAAGEYLGFPGDGDVLRPVVLADPRSETEAFIFDCAISGSHYLDAEGNLAPGEVGGTIEAPLIVRLVLQDDRWLVDDIQDDERACA